MKGGFIKITIGKIVSVLIAVRGGRDKFLQKCLNYIMSQLRVKGGGVNLIETLSENIKKTFSKGVTNIVANMFGGFD